MKIIDQEKMERIKALLKTHPRGLSITNLASITGLNRNLIAKYLDMLVISGQVEIQQYGPAKVYFLSQRIPVSAMIEITSDLVMVLDQDRKIVHVNKPFTRFLAMKRENLLGKTIGEVGHPFLSSIPLPESSSPLDTGDGGTGEVRYGSATGDTFFRIKRAPAVFEDGAVGLTLIIEDITEQKKYEETLRLSEARYRGIVQDQTEFINRYLPDTTLTFVNHAICLFANRPPGDLLGKRFIDMIPEEERGRVRQNIGALTPENPTATIEHRMADGRGRVRWLHWTNRAIFDEKGVILEYQGMGRDITDQRETAEKISQYILQLEFISRKAMEFVHSEPGDDIYRIIARGTKALYPDAMVCVHSFEGKTDTMKVEVMLDEEARVRIQEVLGRDPVGNRIHLTPKIRSMAMDGLIHRVSGTDYLGCFVETVPEKSRPTATKIMEGSDVYLMGLTYLNELFGDVILMFPEKTQLQHQNLLETYLNQASVAVQRQIYQEELRRSREEYRRIVENADEGIWVLDRDYRTTFVNQRLARMLGYVPEELVGVQIERFMLPEDIPAHHRRIAERRTGLSGHFEQRFQRKDGSLIWAAANATPLFESGEFAGAFAMLTDITVEKQAEGALRESEERYRDLTEASFDIIFTIDREDRLAYANRRCLEFLGRRYEEVVGKPRASLFTPEISEKMKENLVKIFSTGEPLLDSANPVVLGDREFWLDTNLIPLKNADGSVNLVMGISRDITLRKKTEDALRESEEKYRALVEQAHDMIVVVQDGIIKFCNQKVAEMWGGDIREIIGQPYERFIDPEELPRVRENYLRRMAGEAAPDLYDTLLLRRDGSRVHVDLSAGTIVFDGRPADLIVLRDITEKKETEEQLKCTYELQKAILDASPVGIGYVSNRTLTWANKAMYRIQGVEPLELRGQHERIVFSDEKEYERVCGQVYHEIGETGFSELETALKRKDGSLVPVSLRAAPIRPGSTDLIILVTDITARKKAEEELRKTHALQQAILAASPMGIGVTANRILIWANEAMSRIHGYGPGEREGQSAQLLYEDEREYERVTREISLAMETGEFRVLETVWRRKDGSRANIRLTVGPVRPGSPEVLSVARDITVQKKAEEELGKTRALKDAILSSSPVGIGVSRNRFLIWENDAMASICGIEKDELEGMPVRAVYESDEEYERITRVGSEAIGSGHFRETETVWVRKDGSSVDVQLSLGPVAPGSSEILAIAQDITARKKAAEQLRQTQALQEAILRASPVGIGLISERTLQWENDAMCEILGIREGELKGQPLDTVFIDEQEYGRTSRVLDQAIRQNGSGEVETVWKRKDGSRVEVSLRVAPVRPGSPEVIGVATDITDRNRAGRALRESEETFRTMVTINPLPLSLIDAKGKYLHVNPSFTRLFGYTLEDIPDGKAWFALAYPDEETREVAIRYWKADAAEHPVGEVRPRTFKVRCKDGSFKDILFLPASTPAGLQVVVYQDLTRETMTERLSDSEDRYRHLVDDLNVGIYRSSGDTEGRFIWGNTGLLSILGYEDLADLRGVPVRDIFQKPGGRKALLRELQEKKFVKNRLLSLKKKDGTPVKVSVTALAEFDEKGKLQFITGLVQEVPRD